MSASHETQHPARPPRLLTQGDEGGASVLLEVRGALDVILDEGLNPLPRVDEATFRPLAQQVWRIS